MRGHNRVGLGLLDDVGKARAGPPGCGAGSGGKADFPGQGITSRDHGTQGLHKRLGIKIHVGQRGKQGFDGKAVGLGLDNAFFTRRKGGKGQAAQGVNNQILKAGGFALFAAHTHGRAADTLGGLFTLVAKHDVLLVFYSADSRRISS